MEKCRIIISELIEETDFEIKIIVSNDVDIQGVKDTFAEVFELEMLTNDVVKGKSKTSLTFTTQNKQKVDLLKQGMFRAFREGIGLGNINLN